MRSGSGWLALSLLSLSGCSVDEQYTGMGDEALPGSPLRQGDETPVCSCPGGGNGGGPADDPVLTAEDLTGLAFRFDSLELSQPLPGALGDALNRYFRDEIDKDTLNVMVHVTAEDREAGTMTLRVGAATAEDDAYRMAEGAGELGCTLTGARFETAEPGFLDFPNSLLVPPELPIRRLELSGLIAADASEITEGVLEGVLTEADAQEISLGGSSFDATLRAMNVALDVDVDGDGTPDAWAFVGAFTAKPAELLEG